MHLATATAIVAITVLLTLVYTVESARIGEARVALLHSAVDAATTIAEAYEKDEQAGRLTHEEAVRGAVKAIGAIRYFGSEDPLDQRSAGPHRHARGEAGVERQRPQ